MNTMKWTYIVTAIVCSVLVTQTYGAATEDETAAPTLVGNKYVVQVLQDGETIDSTECTVTSLEWAEIIIGKMPVVYYTAKFPDSKTQGPLIRGTLEPSTHFPEIKPGTHLIQLERFREAEKFGHIRRLAENAVKSAGKKE